MLIGLKVAAIIGIMGNCRICELRDLTIDDCDDFGTAMMVTIRAEKSKHSRQFTISGEYYQYCRKYMDLRPINELNRSFFLTYQRGKCISQSIGRNRFTLFGKQIAEFLKLPNPELYFGASLRKSGFKEPN